MTHGRASPPSSCRAVRRTVTDRSAGAGPAAVSAVSAVGWRGRFRRASTLSHRLVPKRHSINRGPIRPPRPQARDSPSPRRRGPCWRAGMRELSKSLHDRPFTTQEALAAGVTPNELRGPKFRRVHRGVYVTAGTDLTFATRVAAARLALPADARISHTSRLRMLGLEHGPSDPIHFTVAGDLHLTPSGIYLHRTLVMPPIDDVGVTPASAFVGFAARARIIDLVGVGDWLLHRHHVSEVELHEIATLHAWRSTAAQHPCPRATRAWS